MSITARTLGFIVVYNIFENNFNLTQLALSVTSEIPVFRISIEFSNQIYRRKFEEFEERGGENWRLTRNGIWFVEKFIFELFLFGAPQAQFHMGKLLTLTHIHKRAAHFQSYCFSSIGSGFDVWWQQPREREVEKKTDSSNRKRINRDLLQLNQLNRFNSGPIFYFLLYLLLLLTPSFDRNHIVGIQLNSIVATAKQQISFFIFFCIIFVFWTKLYVVEWFNVNCANVDLMNLVVLNRHLHVLRIHCLL